MASRAQERRTSGMKGLAVMWYVLAMTTSATTSVRPRVSVHFQGNVAVQGAVSRDENESCLNACLANTIDCLGNVTSLANETSYPDSFDMIVSDERRFFLQASVVDCIHIGSGAYSQDVYVNYNCNFSMDGYEHIFKLALKTNSEFIPSYQLETNNPTEQQMHQVLHYTQSQPMDNFIENKTLSYRITSYPRSIWVKLYVIKYACCNSCTDIQDE